jgi:phenylacetate-CoA ligase
MLARYAYYFYELGRNLHTDHHRLLEMETKRMRSAIKHAYEHVPFYRRKFDEARIKPDDVKSVEDLSKIPVTTKTELQATSLSDTIANTVDINDCFKRVTSGSTGIPLTIIVDKKAEDFRLAMWARAYAENGLRLMDRLATIKDPLDFADSRRLLARLNTIRRREISVFDDPQRQMSILEAFKPQLLKGYSSSLVILADYFRIQEHSFRPRLIFTGAETLLETDRKKIGSAFGCDVLDYYGSIEFSLLGWECDSHMGYHMNTDATLIEFVNNEEVVAPGERGEIVCTSLINSAMPLIRYRIGDLGVPIKEPCSCGRSLPLMKMLEGRTGDFLTTLDGRIISPTIFSPYPFGNLTGIKQFRVIQETRGKITIELAVDKDFQYSRVLGRARREVQRVFGKDMQVDFRMLEKIDKDPTGKLRKVISHVPIA